MKKRRRPPRRSAAKIAAEPARAPTYDDLLQIVHLIESGSRFSEFRLRAGDIEVEIRRVNGAARPVPEAQAKQEPATPVPGAARAERAVENLPSGAVVVRAPMVGTFYRSPAPGEPPFVEPGTRVAADTVVCIIEVMKLMNSITAGVAGVVTHVLVDDAAPVEYGQPLIAIDPHA